MRTIHPKHLTLITEASHTTFADYIADVYLGLFISKINYADVHFFRAHANTEAFSHKRTLPTSVDVYHDSCLGMIIIFLFCQALCG